MRRIYESDAIRRGDDDPFSPAERDASVRPQALRSVNAAAASQLVIPNRVRYRAVSVSVSTPRRTYPAGTPIPFDVTMRNSMPFPVVITTDSPVAWSWSVDGVPEASRASLRDPPDGRGEIRFDRGERKRFRKLWNQRFRVSKREWEPAEPGEYAIEAALAVTNAGERGLSGETAVSIVPSEADD